MIHIIETSTAPSERVLLACGAFGIGVRHVPGSVNAGGASVEVAARSLHEHLPSGGLALITGASGSGKSTLLAAVVRLCQRDGQKVVAEAAAHDLDTPLADQLDLPLSDTLAQLARVGLGVAAIFCQSPRQLSEGERFRLRLAHALAGAGDSPTTVMIDEFASVLDRPTARCLCFAVRRWVKSLGVRPVRVIVATAHTDVEEWLAPDMVVRMPEDACTAGGAA